MRQYASSPGVKCPTVADIQEVPPHRYASAGVADRIRRAIRLRRVCDLTGASRATVWRWAKDNPQFPKPFPLSGQITCWDEDEILDWLASRKAARGGK